MNGVKGIKQVVKDAVSRLPGGEWLVKQRFAKFGAVGFAGTLVNLAVLYVAQEFVYPGIDSGDLRFNLSLATAIFFATLHNFIWNRAWTWRDRKAHIRKSIGVQFMQYCAACWLAIALQFVFTNFLKQYMYYMLANFLAIAMTAILNYLINHSWTFKARK
jgi:dolichol-phosphate mannosyltransferase